MERFFRHVDNGSLYDDVVMCLKSVKCGLYILTDGVLIEFGIVVLVYERFETLTDLQWGVAIRRDVA